jgi:BCD family chlorophyll transporter-like MFS transporter
MAAGFGGLLGAAAVDAMRAVVSDPSAFGTVFLAEAALFLVAAVMALRIMDRAPARAASPSLVPGE